MLPLLAGLLPSIIEKGVDIFDRKFKTDAEKQEAVRKYKKEAVAQMETAWESEQKELTARLEADVHSDSWLSKNIRPMVLVYLMILFTLAFFRDVPEATMELLQSLLLTTFAFYFGSRTLEKMMNVHIKGKKNG